MVWSIQIPWLPWPGLPRRPRHARRPAGGAGGAARRGGPLSAPGPPGGVPGELDDLPIDPRALADE